MNVRAISTLQNLKTGETVLAAHKEYVEARNR